MNLCNTRVNLKVRDYNPRLGRFQTLDPISSSPGAAVTSGYAYAANNPVNLTDPSGLTPTDSNFLPNKSMGFKLATLVGSFPDDPPDNRNRQTCTHLINKIFQHRREVNKRRTGLAVDKFKLDHFKPGAKLRDTIDGHQKLLEFHQNMLAKLVAEYLNKCGGPPPSNPLLSPERDPIRVPAPNPSPYLPRVGIPDLPWNEIAIGVAAGVVVGGATACIVFSAGVCAVTVVAALGATAGTVVVTSDQVNKPEVTSAISVQPDSVHRDVKSH